MFAAASCFTLFACGGDDGGGGGGNPDAKVFMDAPKVFMDAPPSQGLSGLGQKCDMNAPCPTGMDCISLGLPSGPSPSYCTPHCLDNGTGTTNGSGQLTSTTPAPNNAACTGGYMGSVGTPQCGVILSYTPMDKPMMANKQYTAIALGCIIQCGTGNMCPTGMTCTSNFCFPNP
jgi:hypothetical protein